MAAGPLTLNRRQKDAVGHEGHLALSACPGSGKTRVIVAKLLQCVDALEGSSRRVGCITYTNAAVAEIESRLRQLGGLAVVKYADVGTIHSFCLNHILRPYHHLLPELEHGYEVTPPDCEWFQDVVRRIGRRFELRAWTLDRFSSVQRQPDGSLFLPDGVPLLAAQQLCEELAAAGRISLSDIVFYSLQLVLTFPYIGRNVGSRFRWLIVDEFQDTTVTQVEIFRVIHGFGRTTFFVVGDPNQSILGFAGASPHLMGEFAARMGAKTDIVLNENYRCSRKIVEVAERIFPLVPPMVSVGATQGCAIAPMYNSAGTPFDCVWDHFLPALGEHGIGLGEAAVLAPWWTTLFGLGRRLRERSIPIVGPGARPYKGLALFAQFSEAAGAYLSSLDADEYARLRRAFFWLVLNTIGDPDWRVYSFDGKRVLARLIAAARDCKERDDSAVGFLETFVREVGRILVAEGYISEGHENLLRESADTMIAGIETNLPDLTSVSIDFLAMFARPADCLQLLTMHGGKGREFDAVAVVDVHDDKVPHWSADDSGVRESKRLMYVASTRARKLLMFFSDTSRADNLPSRFLGAQGLRLITGMRTI